MRGLLVAPIDLGELLGDGVRRPQSREHAEHDLCCVREWVDRLPSRAGGGFTGVGDDVGEDPPHLLVGGLLVDGVDRRPDGLVAQDAAVDDELGALEVGPAAGGGPPAVGQLDAGVADRHREGLEGGREGGGAPGGDGELGGDRRAEQVAGVGAGGPAVTVSGSDVKWKVAS